MSDPYAAGSDAAVMTAAADWLAAGHGVHLITVVRTWGSSPRPPGSLLARRDDGREAGSVSGGCVEAELPAFLPSWGEPPRLLTFGADTEEAERLGLPCGGSLVLFAEALTPDAPGQLAEVRAAMEAGTVLRRRVALVDGAVTLAADTDGPELAASDQAVTKRFGPAWRLLVVGAGDLGHHLAGVARRLGFGVTVCDPRDDKCAAFAEPGAALDGRMPDDAVAAWVPDPRGAVVAATHDPKLDDLALLEALPSSAFYVGALGSARTDARRRERLRALDVPEECLARLRGPMGVAIGSRTPAEIAVAVAAELTAVRRDRDPLAAGAGPV